MDGVAKSESSALAIGGTWFRPSSFFITGEADRDAQKHGPSDPAKPMLLGQAAHPPALCRVKRLPLADDVHRDVARLRQNKFAKLQLHPSELKVTQQMLGQLVRQR